MKFKIIFLFMAATGFISAQNSCSTATAITPGIYTVNYQPASQLPTPICTNGANNPRTMAAWYKYTPADDVETTVNTGVEGYSNRDTRVHIYSGDCSNLVCRGSGDDEGPDYTSIARFQAIAGITYYIAFDNNWNSENFAFNLTEAELSNPQYRISYINIDGNKIGIADMNGDYLDDVIAPSGNTVNLLYQNISAPFTPATLNTPAINFGAGWSMAAGDYDKNGFNDLLYGDGAGATLLLANATGTAFNTKHETSAYLFSQRTNFVDINNDGNLDAFICHDVEPNVYFLNNGNGGATYHQGGVGDYPTGGNYGSIWIDYDNDGDIDLFIAKCRGGENEAAIDELHRNNGDGTFTNVAQQAGFADLHQSWSAAWADLDNDGDMDVLVGSNAIDGLGHKLMVNNGNGTFSNVTNGSGFELIPQIIDREHVAHDFDNDGFADIFAGNNTIMHNNGDMSFSPVTIPVNHGPIGDLNNDGFLDIQNDNTIAYRIPNGNNWIKVLLQGVASNRNGIGARVEILGDGNGWTKQIRDVKSGDGFRYMSSLNTHFGLGSTNALDMVVVKWPSGTIDYIQNPNVNHSLTVVEGSFPLSRLTVNADKFILYPNPAKETLTIKGTGSFMAVKGSIYSVDGKLIKTAAVNEGVLPVHQLTKGTYILILQDAAGKSYSSKFIKG